MNDPANEARRLHDRERQRRCRANRQAGRIVLRGVGVDRERLEGYLRAQGLIAAGERVSLQQLSALAAWLVDRLTSQRDL